MLIKIDSSAESPYIMQGLANPYEIPDYLIIYSTSALPLIYSNGESREAFVCDVKIIFYIFSLIAFDLI